MLKKEIINFYENRISDLDVLVMQLSDGVAKDVGNYFVRARPYGFKVVDIKDTDSDFKRYGVVDGSNRLFSFLSYEDKLVKIGDIIFVPGAFIRRKDKIVLQTCKGFYRSNNVTLSKGKYPIDEFIEKGKYKLHEKIADRFYVLREKEPANLNEYLNSLKLKDYYAEYEPDTDIGREEASKNRKPQSIDSRQSKVYILDKHTHKIIKETNAILSNHKQTQLGIDADTFRRKENEKISELLKEIGINFKDVIFARKERSSIIVKNNQDKEVLLKARFAEIDFNTHMDVNPNVRFTKFGDITYKYNNWYFDNFLSNGFIREAYQPSLFDDEECR